MNFPTNLLFDIELAKIRLKEAFDPATGSDDWRKRSAATGRMDQSPTRTNEGPIPPSFRLPEVSGCASISFQAL
jgi:hypothetical protein